MAKSVELRSIKVELRTFPVTRALLKQAKHLHSLPQVFRVEGGTDVNETCIGWVRGSAIGEDEYTNYLVFVHNEQLYIYGWPGYKGVAKQFYI